MVFDRCKYRRYRITHKEQDFVQVSGVGGEQRALADSETATQANIIDVNTKVRETVQRQDVVEFVAGVVHTLCELIQEYWTTPMFIQTNVDIEGLRNGSPTAVQEAADITQIVPPLEPGETDKECEMGQNRRGTAGNNAVLGDNDMNRLRGLGTA